MNPLHVTKTLQVSLTSAEAAAVDAARGYESRSKWIRRCIQGELLLHQCVACVGRGCVECAGKGYTPSTK